MAKPEIRFKGFINDWKESEYSGTFTNIPNNTLSRADLNYSSGLAKNIHYGDVLIKFRELLDIEKDEIPFISNDDLANKYKASKLQNGDIIIADAAEDETVGKCTELINVSNKIIFSGLHTIPVRPTIIFASKYLGYFMNSPAYHNQLLRLMQGTKVLSISKSAIKDTSILFPIDNIEQSKIGNYFQKLDKLISLNQQKYKKLVILKKAMLEKMFPKNGASVPEIRFKGFTGDWEERNLGDVAKLGSSKRVHREDYAETGIPFFRGTEISKLGESSILEDVLYISEKYYTNLKEKYGVPQPGDILITAVGTLGNPYLISDNSKFYFKDGNLIWISDIQINSEYLNIFLGNGIGKKRVIESAAGSNQKALTMVKLQNVQILFPSKDEQLKIGNYFQNLNKLISLHQQELEELKNIKKALLEKMFV